MNEPTQTMTAVATKTVTKTQMALALAFLGVSAIAAAAMGVAAYPVSVCTEYGVLPVEMAVGEPSALSVCKGKTLAPKPDFDQFVIQSYSADNLRIKLKKNNKQYNFKVGEYYKPFGKMTGSVVGYQQQIYLMYGGQVGKKADINLFWGYPAGGDGVFCTDTDESQKNFDGTAVKDFKFVNPYVKGVASYYDEELDEMVPVEDSCAVYQYGYNGGYGITDQKNLVEGYCSTSDGGKWLSSVIFCMHGCVDGACVYVAAPIVEPVTPSSTPQTATSTLSFSQVKPYTSPKYFIPGQTVDLAKYELKSGGTESIKVKSIKFTQLIKDEKFSVASDIKSLWLVDETGAVLSESFFPYNQTPLVEINKADLIVAGGKTKTITLKGIVNDMIGYENGPAYSGHSLGYLIAGSLDVTAASVLTGSASKTNLDYNSQYASAYSYVFRAYPVINKLSVSSTKLSNGTRDLFKFKVAAFGGDISLYKFYFQMLLTGNIKVSDLYLFDVTSQSNELVLNGNPGIKEDTTPGNAVWSTTGDKWKTNFPAGEIVVSKEQPRILVLRGNVSGAFTGSSISTKLLGASNLFGNYWQKELNSGEVMGTIADMNNPVMSGSNAFIWSDISVASHSTESKDWTTGYNLPGLTPPPGGTSLETLAY